MEYFSRWEMYRFAGRKLRYPVYVAMEVIWTIGSIVWILDDLLLHRDGWLTISLMILLVLLSVLHSISLTMTMPWVLLKSLLLGGIVFGIAYAISIWTHTPFGPATLAVIVASGHYIWSGEMWTKAQARQIAETMQATTATGKM